MLFVEFKTTIEIPILRVLGKMLQFKTAGHPYCHMLPCAAAEPGKGTGSEGRNQLWLLSVSTCRSWCVCLCWEVFVSQLMAGNTHRHTPNSKDLICITLSVCTHAPSFQQHPRGQTAAAWECLLPHLLAMRSGLFFTPQPLIYPQKSLVLKRQLDTEKLKQFSPAKLP